MLNPAHYRRRFIKGIAASTSSLLLPWHARFANAMPVDTGSVWQPPSARWASIASTTMIPNLARWLSLHTNVRDAILWQMTNAAVVPYTSWGSGIAALNDAFVHAYQGTGNGLNLPLVPTNVAVPTDLYVRTAFAAAEAWSFYLAHVAHCLAVELRGDLPWSITTMPANELKVLFDSRQFFVWANDLGAYAVDNSYADGYSTLAPPDYVYGFLQANAIPNPEHIAPGQTQLRVLYAAKAQAFGRLLLWCADKMKHFEGKGSAANCWAHWQYIGCPPVARVLEGTINPAVALTKRHFTAGCYGTTAFLRSVARTMNIAVEVHYLPPIGHCAPFVPALNVWLGHGDDPYSAFSTRSAQLVGLDLSYPSTDLLIDDATHKTWWDPALSDAQILNNHNRRTTELAVAELPYGLLASYNLDQFKNNSHANGYVADNLSSCFTLADLDAMNLWQQMDAKIAAIGGSSAMYKLETKVALEMET